jgi:hypothetical protein
MYRKLIALGATAVIAAAAFAPTAASAKGGKGHWHGHGHGGVYVGLYPGYVDTTDCYIVNKVVWINHHKRLRQIEVCG